MSRGIVCQSCDEQKMSLQRIKSKVIDTMELNLCKTCSDLKLEPRWLIILAIRSNGVTKQTRDIINQRRYIGEEIAASDIV